jgi:hypothetical protein
MGKKRHLSPQTMHYTIKMVGYPAQRQSLYKFNPPGTIGRSLTLSPSWERINWVEAIAVF